MISIARQHGSESPIARLLRRSILQLTRDSTMTQDYFDLADLAEAIAAPHVAAVARNSGFLQQGFAEGPAAEGEPLGPIERAVTELRTLMDRAGEGLTAEPAERADTISACADLVRLFRASLDEPAEHELSGLLAAWHDLVEAPPVDPRAQVDADLDTLLSAFATRELQSFLQRNRSLAYAPYGSARLLHRSARLGLGGLGPFLMTVRNLIRSGRDILGLITLAAGDDAPSAIDAWTVPLATYLHEHQAAELVDELADLGLLVALRGLLATVVDRRDRMALIRHLRDAAMDLGDDLLAWSAQHALLQLEPLNMIEWRCLGDMLASGGDPEGAAEAFNHALRLAPDDSENRAHLAALQAGDFSRYSLIGGFGTPRPRQLIRFARRAA